MTRTPVDPVVESGAVRLPRGGLLAFSSGTLGMGVWITVPGLLLLYFLTDVLAVAPLVAGFALLIPKVADILLHPFVGHVSDAQRARHGHRLALMVFACLLPLSFAAMFAVPGSLRGNGAAIWVAVFYALGNLLYAAYQVPNLSTPADLAIGYHERTRLMSFRMVVLTVGILASGVLAPALTGGDDPTRRAYLVMGCALAVGMLAAMLVGITGVRRLGAVAGTPANPAPPHLRDLRVLLNSLRDPHFRPLVGAFLLTSTATHLVLAAVPYFAAYELGRSGLTTVLVAAFLAPALLATPVWLAVARRIGKQRGLLLAQSTFAAGCLVVALGHHAPLPLLIGVVAVLGIAFAALQLLAFSMLPDVVAAGAGRKIADAGSYTGVWTAADSAGGAIGPYLYAACLAIGGFVGSSGDDVQQSAAALDAVRYGFALVPAVLLGAAVIVQRRYSLDRDASTVEQVVRPG
ncbi:MFS transporter [Asanoa iriomotensis]|uniref:MFS transporter n=1 Tax=Asanoa iriomotensis TaxID=234613 RepID=A0ABQ4BZZ1_9ACTN|nr:MFS transporter [Asanoa iriomotensis]GIF56091.1 MFS transporter [Asanoa iriomotensis]